MFDINFQIPSSVIIEPETGPTITYMIFWIDEFPDKKQIGETDYEKKQIIIKKGMDILTTFWTFFHELEHAISREGGLRMTERQVNGLEIGLAKTSEANGWMKKRKKVRRPSAV